MSAQTQTLGQRAVGVAQNRKIGAIVFVLFLAVLPQLLGDNRAILAFLILVGIYSIAGQSIVLLYGASGIMSVGHGALVGVSGYITAIVATRTDLPFVVVVVIGVLSGIAVAGLLAATSIRTGGHYFVIVTFAFGEIAVAVANNLTSLTGGNGGLSFVKPLNLLGFDLGPTDLIEGYYLSAIVLVLSMLLLTFIMKSSFGKRLTSIRENQKLASALGVNVRATKLVAFMLSAVFTGLAGVLWAYQTHYLSPSQFSPAKLGITLVLIALIGGSRSTYGPVIGASIALLGPQFLGLSPYVNEMILGSIFIAVILLMPEGVTGAWRGGLARLAGRITRSGSKPPGGDAVAEQPVEADVVGAVR